MMRVRRWLERVFRERAARKVLRREEQGLDPKYGRLIVVCGMARTGTSATAAYIGTHPDVTLLVGGGLWYVAETDVMKNGVKWHVIDALLKREPLKRLAVKQPWLEGDPSFFKRAQGAKVVVCRRSYDTIEYGWLKSEMVGQACKCDPKKVYSTYEAFGAYLRMLGAIEVWPERDGPGIAVPLSVYLKLDRLGFDRDRMERKWRNRSERAWLEKHALWEDGI